jgi:hypothetical protein
MNTFAKASSLALAGIATLCIATGSSSAATATAISGTTIQRYLDEVIIVHNPDGTTTTTYKCKGAGTDCKLKDGVWVVE